MQDSVYKVIQIVGTSPNSWEEAARNAVETASRSLRDLRVAEIEKLDLKIEDGIGFFIQAGAPAGAPFFRIQIGFDLNQGNLAPIAYCKTEFRKKDLS